MSSAGLLAYRDAFLTDDDIQCGLFPRLGGKCLRTISVLATFIETDRGFQTW